MLVSCVMAGPLDTNAYLVVCVATKEAIIVDPSPESFDRLVSLVDEHGAKPVAIYLTHTHFDHIIDIPKVKEKYNCPIFVHEIEKPHLATPGMDGIPLYPNQVGIEADHTFSDGDKGRFGEVEFTIMHTPGHSPGSSCFYFPKESVLISGDTLFKSTHGIVHLKESDPDKMQASLQRLITLPEKTLVYPGHGGSTTIAESRSWICR